MRRPVLGGVVLLLTAVLVPTARAAGACSQHAAPGGDWPRAGHDAANTRTQTGEHLLTPAVVPRLAPAWTFSTGDPSGDTSGELAALNSTPVVAGGCVFVAGAVSTVGAPNVFALDARTGRPVWRAAVVADPAGLGGTVVGAPLVSGPRVLVLVNQLGDGHRKGPYVVALDRSTGRRLWTSAPVTTEVDSYTNASLALGRGVVLAGFSGREGNPYSHGGVGLVDERTGQVLTTTWSVPRSRWGTPTQPLYGGGGVWTTPAVDEAGGYAYFGTGNPFSKKVAYPTTNAVLKLDLDRGRPTFGRVVGWSAGEPEQANELLMAASRPTCELVPDDEVVRNLPLGPFQGVLANSYTCAQLDLDFGAAPNLIDDPHGLLVGDLQKSGVYHAVDARTMRPRWSLQLGLSCQVCNASSTAYDPVSGLIGAASSPGSTALAVPAVEGASPRWRAPMPDVAHYEPMSIAAGVLYTPDLHGFLHAWDLRTGMPLLVRPLLVDAGLDSAAYDSSSGVAIALHTVFVAAGNHVTAYRVP